MMSGRSWLMLLIRAGLKGEKVDLSDDRIISLSSSGYNILVVEDNELVRSITLRVLENAGYGVISARDADSAIELYKRYTDSIDLVMINVILPRIDGIELYGELQTMNSEVKVLFLSGYFYQEEVSNRVGRDVEFLAKPYMFHQLLGAVSKAMGIGNVEK